MSNTPLSRSALATPRASTPRVTTPRGVAAASLLAAAGALGLAPAAGAQTADTTGRPAAEAADSARIARLRAVTVTAARQRGYVARRTTTATRTDTPLRDVPQAVSVVTRQLIADQAMQNMTDVLRYVPGITMGQGEGHRDAPTIRGQASTADFFVDGVRDDAQYLRDVYNVERVEAIKGANATIFGRGGGGGVVNRVLKGAEWAPTRALSVQGGSFEQRRGTVDVGQGFGRVAGRVNGMWEHSAGFRDAFDLRRYGVNPTVAIAAGARTVVRGGYERFADDRTVDRGLPSFRGRPSDAEITTFFGDPSLSGSRLDLHAGDLAVEHQAGGLTVRNRSRMAHYDKFYGNVFPGAVNTAGTQVALSAYNSTARRHNLFNQTDLTGSLHTGTVRHTLLAGAEFGRQTTDNQRETGYFGAAGSTVTSTLVPLADPRTTLPVTFRRSATDADNRVLATVAAAYVQDQVALTRHVQALAGLRVDQFAVRVDNRRNGETLRRDDRLVSPRLGLVVKPVEPVSVYATRTVSFLPSAGDQFAGLTPTTQALRPERFTNHEVGAKWDVASRLALTAAAYELDRSNSSAPDPTNPARTVQTGAQRTRGVEVGVSGEITDRWQVAGGFVTQQALLTSRTGANPTGRTVPLVPPRAASLWNRVQVTPALALGLGVLHQGRSYAAIDNAVTLPAFTRLDGAAFVRLPALVPGALKAQINVENLLNARYYGTSHGNNNIMPGAPRTVRITLATGLP
jgi:catecholate siderophore receptor